MLSVLNAQGYQRKAVVFGIRPEDIFTSQASGEAIAAKISVAELTGAEFAVCHRRGHELVVRAGAATDYAAGDNIGIQFDMNKCHFLTRKQKRQSDNKMFAGNINFRFLFVHYKGIF